MKQKLDWSQWYDFENDADKVWRKFLGEIGVYEIALFVEERCIESLILGESHTPGYSIGRRLKLWRPGDHKTKRPTRRMYEDDRAHSIYGPKWRVQVRVFLTPGWSEYEIKLLEKAAQEMYHPKFNREPFTGKRIYRRPLLELPSEALTDRELFECRITRPGGFIPVEQERVMSPEDYELYDKLKLLYSDQRTPEYKAKVYANLEMKRGD